MVNELSTFTKEEFGTVRTMMIDGEAYFCAKDVSECLGYANARDALKKHVDDEDKRLIQRSQIATLEIPNRGMTFVNESGVYSLVFGSKLPTAKKFKRWITSEVIPSIRKTGSYSMTKQDSYMIEDPIERAKRWIEEQEEKKKLEVMNAEKDQVICELQPKADYADDILLAAGTVTATQIAKEYGMPVRSLNNLLHTLGIQYKVNGQWVLYAKYADKGYTESCTKEIKHTYGKSESIVYTRWTQKGRQFLYELLKNEGIYPIKKAEMNK